MSKKLAVKSKIAVLPPLAVMPPPMIVLRRKSWLRCGCAMQALLTVPAAISIGVTLARPAHAATVINTNKTSTVVLSNTTNYPGGNPFSLTAGHTITASGNGVYGNNAQIWTLSNAGSIISTGSYGVDLVGGSISNKTLSSIYGEIGGAIITGNTIAFVSNAINGTISGGNFGVELNSSQATLKNSGKILGTNLTNSSGAILENGGYVINHSTSTIAGYLYGLKIANGVSTLQNNGSINAAGIGVLLGTDPGTLNNIGFITQSASNSSDAAIKMAGGYLHNGATSLYTLTPAPVISGFANGVITYGTIANIVNNSTIQGTGVFGNGADGIILGAGGTITNSSGTSNTAFIYGVADAISLTSGGAVYNLSGTIHGNLNGINLGSGGGYVSNSTAGILSGGQNGIYGTGTFGAVYNSGTITGSDGDGVRLTAGGLVTNYAVPDPPETITGSHNGVYISGTLGTVINYGLIQGTSAAGVALLDGGTVTNASDAEIIGFTNGVVAQGINASSISNSGSIIGTGGYYGEDQYSAANGILLGGGGGTIVNNSNAVISGETGDGILSNDGGFSVSNSGTIFGQRYGVDSYIPDNSFGQSGAVAIANSNIIQGIEGGIFVSTGQASISNSGSIIGTDYAGIYLAGGGSITNGTGTDGANAVITGGYNGIYSDNLPVSVTNYGTITGSQASGIQLNAGGTVSNLGWNAPETASGVGTISGAYDGVYISGGTGSVLNNGVITGTTSNGVELHNGGLVANSGLITGSYAGVYTGYAFNTLNNAGSVFNEGTIIGGTLAGVAMFSGGTVQNAGLIRNTGTFGYGVTMYGPDSRMTNWGTITTGRFGQGVRLNNGGSVANYGLIKSGLKGVGVYLYNGGSISNGGSAVIEGLYGIKAAHTFAVAYNTGTIIGYKDGVNLLDGGAVINVVGEEDSPFNGTGSIYGKQKGINVDGTFGYVYNDGSIGGGLAGVDLLAGGVVYNGDPEFDGGTITGGTFGVLIGGNSSIIGAFNIGLISGGSIGVDLTAGGYIVNAASGEVGGTINGGRIGVYAYGYTTLNNAGLIQSTLASDAAYGVSFANGGIVTNSSSGLIQGYRAGISVNGSAGSIGNAGTIQALGTGNDYAGINLYAGGSVSNAQSGLITGTGQGAYIAGGAGSVANAGSINGGGIGVYLADGGTISNSSTGMITGGTTGIYGGTLASVNVMNDGSITGGSSFGVALYGSGAVANTGSISGGYAGVKILGSYASVTNTNSDEITGTITGTKLGVYLNADNSSVVNSGVISGGVYQGVASIGSISNSVTNQASGTIAGASDGVEVGGATNNTVDNSGLITGTNGAGVNTGGNSSTVAVTNELGGTITGGGYGVDDESYNYTLTNNGAISGGGDGGAFAYEETVADIINGVTGTITGPTGVKTDDTNFFNLDNSGLISGAYDGVFMSEGSTADITNELGGTILGDIYNENPTLSVDNSGLISGNSDGIFTGGSLSNITNEQTGTIAGAAYGYEDGSAFGSLVNNGLIEGEYAVYTYGSVSNVLNTSTGTIAGGAGDGIYADSGIDNVTNQQGGTISGQDGIDAYSTQFSLDNAGLVTGGDANNTTGLYTDTGTANVTNEQGGTITGGEYGVYSTSGSFSLDNAGSIDGGSEGVYVVSGSIANVINEVGGVISSDDYGLWSYAHQFSLDNKGVISGNGEVGVGTEGDNDSITNEQGGTITGYEGIESYSDQFSLDNAGLVMATGDDGYGVSTYTDAANVTNEQTGTISGTAYGVDDDSDQFSLNNKGLITGGTYGAYLEYGGTVTNTGTIIGGATGLQVNSIGSGVAIDNAGTIIGSTGTGVVLQTGTLTNEAGGVIQGGYDGIAASNGAAITNAGLIADTSGSGQAGVVLNGTSTSLINLATGTITGTTGVMMNSDDETLVNAGTIVGTGGTAIQIAADTDPAQITLTSGSALGGNIDGGGTDGQITLTGTNVIGNSIVNFGAGSALTVAPEADWTAAGNWTIETATNNGVFQGGVLGTPLNLTGNFVQSSLGTLRVVVTPTLTSQFLISGSASLAGNLTYVFAPGFYKPTTLDFLQAAGGVTVNNLTINYVGGVPAYLSKTTNNGVTIASGTLGSSLVLGYVAPLDDSVFSDVNQEAAGGAQAVNDSLLDKAAEGAGASANSAACAAEAGAAPANTTPGVSTAGRMATALGNAFCGAGGWIQATGTEASMDGNGDAPGFNAESAGFLAGIDKPVGQAGTRLGLAVGYDETWLHDSEGGKGNADTTRVGLFGSQPLGRFTLAADFMYGYANNNTTRQTGIGGLGASYSSNIFSGGLQGDTTLPFHGFMLNPAAGLRFASLNSGSFSETAGPELAPFALSGDSSGYTSIQPYVNVGVSRSFLTGSAISITPQALVGYTAEVGNRGKSVNLTVQDGTMFASAHSTPDAGAAELSAGVAAGKNNWSLFARYSAYVSGNWTAQTGEAGLQIKF